MKRISIFVFGIVLCAASLLAQRNATPGTALADYLSNGDPTYAWEVRDSTRFGDVTAYSLLFISQKWQGMLWRHELVIFVPEKRTTDGALLFVGGGAVKEGAPNYVKRDDAFSASLAGFAKQNGAVAIILRQVPNQPLYGGLNEDALISFTLDNFRKSGDYSWPLLFPMVKSAVKAMDVAMEFSEKNLGGKIGGFVISGASKRGWTTWLTAASGDTRVKAIAPMVIDMLNLPATLRYQQQIYGEYSKEIEDYVKMGIPQAMGDDFGASVVEMIDPYSYREKLNMPKMIFMGTNDPYWTVDAVKHYIYEIPGQNMLHYVANAGHDLGDKTQALKALGSFFAIATDGGGAYPVCTSVVEAKKRKIVFEVRANAPTLLKARLWIAQSETRDFRKARWEPREIPLDKKSPATVMASLSHPQKGFQAFYMDLIYPSPSGDEFSVSSRIYVSGKKQVFIK